MNKKLMFVLVACAVLVMLAFAACATMQRYPTCLNDQECKQGQQCVEQLCIQSPKAQ